LRIKYLAIIVLIKLKVCLKTEVDFMAYKEKAYFDSYL